MHDVLNTLSPYVRLAHDFPTLSGFYVHNRKINDHALLYFKSGAGTFTIGKKIYPIEPETVFIIRPNILHSLANTENRPFYMLNLHFDPVQRPDSTQTPYFRDPQMQPVARKASMLPVLPAADGLPWRMRLQTPHVYESLFFRIHHAFIRAGRARDLAIKSAMIDILAFLYAQVQRDPDQDPGDAEQLDAVLRAMRAEPARHWDVEQAAQIAAMSRSSFVRRFTAHFGCSPIRMLVRVRIEAAKTLLIENRMTIKQVASHLGFQSVHHFTRTFGRIAGLSPGAFRASYSIS